MLTDQEIQDLIRSSKEIKEKIPIREYKEENGHRRCNLKLETIEDEEVKFFSVFIRQNSFFWRTSLLVCVTKQMIECWDL